MPPKLESSDVNRTAHPEHTDAAADAKAKLQAQATYRVCKGGNVVFPPNKCPEQEAKFIQF